VCNSISRGENGLRDLGLDNFSGVLQWRRQIYRSALAGPRLWSARSIVRISFHKPTYRYRWLCLSWLIMHIRRGFSSIFCRYLRLSSYNLGIGVRQIIARHSVRPNAEALDYWWRRRFYTKRMRWRGEPEADSCVSHNAPEKCRAASIVRMQGRSSETVQPCDTCSCCRE
jgi:hypothetical protein